MIVSTAIQKMIEFYKGNRHDVNHFLKVWAMAKTIGELEGLDRHTPVSYTHLTLPTNSLV